MLSNAADIVGTLKDSVLFDDEDLIMGDRKRFREKHLDWLVQTYLTHPHAETRQFLKWILLTVAQQSGVLPSSIFGFYRAKAQKRFEKMTVPAIPVGACTYEDARKLMRAAQASNAMALLLEVPLDGASEDLVTMILSAAVRENRPGPVFFQATLGIQQMGQVEDAKAEIERATAVGIYNFNIDASRLVDPVGATFEIQQQPNFQATAALLRHIRQIQPEGININVGGSISGRTSVVDELRAINDGLLQTQGDLSEGISKVILANPQSMPDEKTLEQLSEVAISAYHLGGTGLFDSGGLSFERLSQANVLEVRSAANDLDTSFKQLNVNNSVDLVADTSDVMKIKPVLPEAYRQLLAR
jgi:hypothetical protein